MKTQQGKHGSQAIATISRALDVLPSQDKSKLFAVLALQVGLGIFDLIGVAAIGVLGALAVTGIQSQEPGARVSSLLELLGLSEMRLQEQVTVLALLAASLLIARTILSVWTIRKIFFFLSRRGAFLSSSLMTKVLSQSLTQIESRSRQETLFALTSGINFLMLNVLGSSITLIADASLLLIMLVLLFIIDPTIAISSIIFFGMLGLVLYKIMNVNAYKLGSLNSRLEVESNEKILEVLETFRETYVRNRVSFYISEVTRLRLKVAEIAAEMQFLPNVSKYVIESGIVIGSIVIAGIQFVLQDAQRAVATLAVFLAAGTRMAPAIMRLQQNAIQIRAGFGLSTSTLALIESVSSVQAPTLPEVKLETRHNGFSPDVQLKSVVLTYGSKSNPSLIDVSLTVKRGDALAIVGPTGAGKTSLVDVLLGLVTPESGEVTIGGLKPQDAINLWPGAIAYVPQEVVIKAGSYRENVALGFSSEDAKDELVWNALRIAHLEEHVGNLPLGLDTPVGFAGSKLSGGEKQRLGIARSLFTQPKLLVLDEATSSLDGQTESDITDAIRGLKGKVTVIFIAHRLSTVLNADQVIYIEKGRILARGSFDEVRDAVENFDTQAKLMGL